MRWRGIDPSNISASTKSVYSVLASTLSLARKRIANGLNLSEAEMFRMIRLSEDIIIR